MKGVIRNIDLYFSEFKARDLERCAREESKNQGIRTTTHIQLFVLRKYSKIFSRMSLNQSLTYFPALHQSPCYLSPLLQRGLERTGTKKPARRQWWLECRQSSWDRKKTSEGCLNSTITGLDY